MTKPRYIIIVTDNGANGHSRGSFGNGYFRWRLDQSDGKVAAETTDVLDEAEVFEDLTTLAVALWMLRVIADNHTFEPRVLE